MTAMGSFSIWHWMLFGAVALLLFGGKGKISDLMGDVAKGVKSFKKGLAEDDEETKAAPTAPADDREPRRRRRQRRSQGRLNASLKRGRPRIRRAARFRSIAAPVSHVRS